MKLKHKALIIFDLDGTLIDSAPDLAVAVNHMLVQVGKETFSEGEIDLWVGNGALTLIQRALSGSRTVDQTLDDAEVQKALKIFLDFYAAHLCVSTVPYANVPFTLNALKSEGYRMAIVTNKPYAFVTPILKSLHLDRYFEMILGGDSLEKKKPDPLPLLHVCQTLEILPEQAVMVGDSKNDILAAQAANIECIAVSYGYNYGEDIRSYAPNVVIDNFADLLTSLSSVWTDLKE